MRWEDLTAAFAGYLVGFLVAGQLAGGGGGRALAVGNLAGAGLAVLAVLALRAWRRAAGRR